MRKHTTFFFLLIIFLIRSGAVIANAEFSLDGKWQIIFDKQNEGSSKKWQYRDNFEKSTNLRQVTVPSCWETIEQDYEGIAWYGKSFKMPDGWKDKTIRINFGAVNYRAEVWLNGEPVGFHDGGYTPFEFEIGDLLKADKENFLVLRIIGPIVNTNTVIEGFGKDDTPHWRGAIAGGIWQTVKLIATESTYIKNVFVEPDIHTNTAKMQITLQNSGTAQQNINASLNIYSKKSPQQNISSKTQLLAVAPGEYKFTVTLPLKNATYWSPDNPFLYILDLNLGKTNSPADTKKTAFGMREFTLKNNDFYLNGKKLYMKTGFWEGLYPNTLAFPENEEIIRKEFALAKEIGFNCLRPWRKEVPPITLELADELGMLIIASPAIECMGQWPTATPFMEARMNIEFNEMVLRDRNHPSVILWELFNEIQRNAVGRLKHKTAMLVRNLDPSRLIIDESGGWYHGSHAYLPYSIQPDTINEIHRYRPSPVANSTYDDFANIGKKSEDIRTMIGGKNEIAPGKLLFVSEIGYGSLPNLDENVKQYLKEGNPITPDYRYHVRLQKTMNQAMDEMKIKDIFPTVGAFSEASQEIQAKGNKIQLEAVRVNPEVDGYCVHAFTDGDWVLGAGILDIFRNKKKTFYTIKEINQPLYLAIRTEKQNLYSGENCGLTITSVNELPQQKGKLIITISGKENHVAFSHEEQVNIPAGITTFYKNNTDLGLKPGIYNIHAQLIVAGKTVSQNQYPFWVYEKEMPALTEPFAFINPPENLRSFIKNNNLKTTNPEAGFSKNETVIIANLDTANEQSKNNLLQVLEHVKNGATAIYLNPINGKPNNVQAKSKYFPFELASKGAVGHWIAVGHVVKSHPIFDGLPQGQLMGQEYQNVCAVKTISNLNDKAIPVVGSLSWDIGIHTDWNYLGPTQAWWGNDLSVIPFGKGKIILSTLRLMENLGKDPVADKILYNMIKWASAKNDIN